jgi:hypothetical protein
MHTIPWFWQRQQKSIDCSMTRSCLVYVTSPNVFISTSQPKSQDVKPCCLSCHRIDFDMSSYFGTLRQRCNVSAHLAHSCLRHERLRCERLRPKRVMLANARKRDVFLYKHRCLHLGENKSPFEIPGPAYMVGLLSCRRHRDRVMEVVVEPNVRIS